MKRTTGPELSVPRAMLHSCPTQQPTDVVIDLPEDYELPVSARKALLRLLLAVHERQQTEQAA